MEAEPGQTRRRGHRVYAPAAVPRRGTDRSPARGTDGRVAAALLASGRACRRRRLHAAPGARARRGPDPVPRRRRPARPAARTLLPPRHNAALRPRRTSRHPLLLPRLAVRCGREMPGPALRAGGWPPARAHSPAVVSGAGALRADLRLYGPAGSQARPAALRMPGRHGRRRIPGSRRQLAGWRWARDHPLQLAAAFRECGRSAARAGPARQLQRRAVHHGHGRHAGGGVRGDRHRGKGAFAASGRRQAACSIASPRRCCPPCASSRTRAWRCSLASN